MIQKLTLEQFRELKKPMLELIELDKQKKQPENRDQSENERIFNEYISLQDKLLSADLSDIPFEEWQGLYIIKDGELDLSKTHANIDFSLLAGINYNSINLQGCNIRGIQALYYDETTFDDEFMKEHPECFPNDSVPAEARKLFYDKKLTFPDLIKYPILRKYVNAFSFKGLDFFNPSKDLVEAIGFENAIRLFDEYPKFVNAITYEEKNKPYSDNKFYLLPEKPFDKLGTYEEAKQFVYELILNEVKQYYFRILPPLDTLPQEMIDSFPNVFIRKGELPEKVTEDYYNGKLSINDIRQYSEILKGKNIELGIHSSSGIRAINEVFGTVWKFIEQVPQKYDEIIEKYIASNSFNKEKLEFIAQQKLSDIITDSIRWALHNRWEIKYISLEELYDFSQYVSVEEIFKNANLSAFVRKCGFENLVKFNKKNNMILEKGEGYYLNNTLLQEMSKYANVIGEDVLITDEQQLTDFFSQIIHLMRAEKDSFVEHSLTINKKELSELFPSEFPDYDLLDKLLKDMNEEDKEQIIKDLENGFNGDTNSLMTILNKNPFLLPVLADKCLIIDKNNKKLNYFYQKVGNKKFLEICSKYGQVLLQIISFIGDDNKKMDDFIFQINTNNYEQQINNYIYNMLGKINDRKFDLRMLPQSFKSEYPELFLDENAPKDLQEIFYGKNNYEDDYRLLDAIDIQDCPTWIPFLLNVNLSKCLKNKNANVYNSKDKNEKEGNTYGQQMNLYEILGQKFSNKEILDFIFKYGSGINNSSFDIDISLEKEGQYECLITSIYNSIKNRQFLYNSKNMPKEFIEKYPELFLDENAPIELKHLFFLKKIRLENMSPEWKSLLQDKDISSVCDLEECAFVKRCMLLGLDNNKIFELFDKYGSYIISCQINLNNINSDNLDQLDNVIMQQIAEAIIEKNVRYNESAKAIIGQEHPELFLDENAPNELKCVFYDYSSNMALTFELLRQHKEWLPYLEGKNVLLSLKKNNKGNQGLEQLFKKYGDQEALRIGIKNPESVMQMLIENKFNILTDWYDKLHFVPHHIVMKEFPFDQSDKFVASCKKWSQLAKIERYGINENSKSALLKASMCFGVFDNDTDGFNKIMQLFSGIPKTLLSQDMQKMIDFIQNQILSLGDKPDLRMLENYNKQLALIQQCYGQSKEGLFSLKINSQQNKNVVQILRYIMEKANVSTILSPDKAHKLFGGFEMKYDPDFRDFILKNMDTILSSDEYIAYISSMQKQWAPIKALNSNRVLSLDLAMAFIKSNNYKNVQIGNQKLAEASNMAGYDQKSFETLQQIYNYGKSRIYSSIPRIHNQNEEYSYEILRLDDPLAIAIGTLTDCCQELGNAAETSMEHSMVDKNGRVFVIKDKTGNIVAQSWVWRNQNVLCFDNIEIPEKAFTRAEARGNSREHFTDTIFALYQHAGKELLTKDEIEFKKLLEEGKITEEQYKALKLGKITVGTGYNDIADSLKRNSQPDNSKVTRPPNFVSPVLNKNLYTCDSSTQYIIVGEQDVPTSTYETPTIYSDEFIIHDNENTNQLDVSMLQKLELVTKGNGYTGQTQSDETEKIVSDIAYNYDLNPETTRIIMNANFAIVYDTTSEEIIIGDILYNILLDNNGQLIDISDKVATQIRIALEQISVKGKKFNISKLSQEQQKMYNKAMNLETEIDEERGLLHGKR